jgi:hypothetical protein
MDQYPTLADAYTEGLRTVVPAARVESVRDPLSKASNFGRGDRPSREVLCHLFAVERPSSCLVSGPSVKLHLPYCFGLLAFALSARNDLDSLRYYRPGAAEFSDDGWTLSGAFGCRLRGLGGNADQISAILARLSADPSSRRTYAAIIGPGDNLELSREYPCAAGIQFFLRDDKLTMLTIMRAQQAFTVLPYDGFLFMTMQLLFAARMGIPVGPYVHFSGTFHIYEAEEAAVLETLRVGVSSASLPPLPLGSSAVAVLIDDLVGLEQNLRNAVKVADTTYLRRILSVPSDGGLFGVARTVLGAFAFRKLGLEEEEAEMLTDLPSDIRALC